jgi:hypothetical protein
MKCGDCPELDYSHCPENMPPGGLREVCCVANLQALSKGKLLKSELGEAVPVAEGGPRNRHEKRALRSKKGKFSGW